MVARSFWSSQRDKHNVLAWVFERLRWVTNVIKAQIGGTKLDVQGLGSFLLTSKRGLVKNQVYARLHSRYKYCPWCMNGWKKTSKKKCKGMVDNSEDKCTETGNCEGKWDGGVLASPMLAPPNTDLQDKNWNPIIPFALKNFHFYTFHAFMCIFDWLLKCHID